MKPQFCSASASIDGCYIVSKGEHEYDEHKNRKEEHLPNTEKFALLDSKGNFIIDFKNNYDFVGIADGIIQVKRNNLYGVVNSKNEIIIPFEYDELEIQNQGIIIVKKNNKASVLTNENKIIIPFIYDEIFSFTENKQANSFYVIVSMGDKKGVIDNYNQFIVGPSKIDLQFITDKSICIKKGKKFSLTDYKLKALLPIVFDAMYFDMGKKRNLCRE